MYPLAASDLECHFQVPCHSKCKCLHVIESNPIPRIHHAQGFQGQIAVNLQNYPHKIKMYFNIWVLHALVSSAIPWPLHWSNCYCVIKSLCIINNISVAEYIICLSSFLKIYSNIRTKDKSMEVNLCELDVSLAAYLLVNVTGSSLRYDSRSPSH